MKTVSTQHFARPRSWRYAGGAALATLLMLGAAACEQPTVPDYNNPSEGSFIPITARSQVQALATGLLDGDRSNIGTQVMYAETMGRDLYRLEKGDTRYITDLLGTQVEASNFIGGAVWPYSYISLADVMIKGSTGADASILSDEAKSAAIGYAQTLKALMYIRAIEMRDSLGVPFGTDLPDGELAPILCKPSVLDGIASILDSAAVALQGGGSSFPFLLPSGFSAFNTPATFLTFNRALAAKVDVYRGFASYASTAAVDKPALDSALVALDASFISSDAGQLDAGPEHLFSTATGEQVNPLFQDASGSDYRANPRVVSEAEDGDQRVARNTAKGVLKSLSDVGSDIMITTYTSNDSPIPIITNKELILIRAEAQWGLERMPEAMSDVNFIRENDAELPTVTITNPDSVLTQILKEKRYSLLFTSPAHWVDSRLFGRLVGDPPAGLGKERGNDPIAAFPIPASEASGRKGITACVDQ
jgi:starch-binding outer membrane protein, SusD/RagB family